MSDPAPPAAPLGPANIGPDGENIVEMTYYETLGIRGDADAGTIKKAYRKQAIRFHPDKNPGNPEAAAKFHEVAEAYAVLSDGNLRAVYNKQGSSSAVAGAGGKEAMPDPGQMFSQLFGGKAFEDWIGEISLGKDVSKAFEMSTTEEERETMKADLVNADGTATSPAATATPQSTIHHAEFEAPPTPASAPPATNFTPAEPFSAKGQPTTSTSLGSATSPPPSVAGPAPVVEDKPDLASSRKMTPEQREKLQLYDKERVEEKRERLRMLASKLRDRIRPFVEASKPGDAEDPETKRYADRIRQEAADLAMESFGVEICNLIGEIYMQKASSYIKLHRKASSNILGIPKFFAGLKQSVQTVKEGWSFLSVGLDVQSAMADMERRQTKGEELGEEEMKQMEADLSGKLLLVAWKGSKFELSTILRTVVDTVLTKEEADVTDATLMNRAKAILLTGAILRSVTPDETDTERRQLETLVLEANRKRKEKGGKGKKAVTVPTP